MDTHRVVCRNRSIEKRVPLGRCVVTAEVFLDDSVALPPGKVGTVVNSANPRPSDGHELFLPRTITPHRGPQRSTKGPSSKLRTGEPAVPPHLPTVAGDLFPARSKPLDPAGLPRYRADPGAPSRTLAVQAPAQGRFPRGSGRPGFHRPGLAVRGLVRALSPS